MRLLLIPALLLVSACGQGEKDADQAAATNTQAVVIEQLYGAGRDRMCLQEQRAGLIVYAAEGDSNCMVRGTADREGGIIRIKPDSDEACSIAVRTEANAVVLGEVSPACAYYCGPKASFSGKRLEPSETGTPAVDLAGDPLC